ncbi:MULTISPECIES: O-antigen ligase family protein [Sporomusaceae]|uniref:O-antigen ligase family protein n=1 Tax=Sporomusaceae TaxID=1843490 RepID=UPI000363E51D|nr:MULTISPECIES: O-antigen ligase family protein [Sporomusaceae]
MNEVCKNGWEGRLAFLIEHCIYAVAFFLPLSLDVASVFLMIGTLGWGAKAIWFRSGRNWQVTYLDGAVGAVTILGALSILASPDPGFSLYNYTHLMGRYVLLYYLVVCNLQSAEQLRKLIWVVLCSAFLVAVYGLYQYVVGFDISATQWVDGEQFPELKTRVFSTLENPNLLAGYLVMMMALASGMAFAARSWKEKGLLLGLTALFGLCLVYTYSRGAWLSVAAVVAIYGWLHNRRIFWIFCLLPLGLLVAQDSILARLTSILNPTDTSSTLRIALWESTIAMIMDNPFSGIGWGAYWMVYPEYDFFINDGHTKIFHAHNMYLNIAAEIGLPGFVAFLTVMYGHWRKARRVLKETKDTWLAGLLLGLLAALGGLFFNGLTDYVLFNIQLSMLFWLLNAIIVVAAKSLFFSKSEETRF